ncbi:ABC transporter permease [Humitalea sp. 24SJ18S-53]|uniref:ABC transporter permease n=1 Tax=Humitalea sp. 24SJ18S-53 TaxID=3422307 RepID=UPI003D668494
MIRLLLWAVLGLGVAIPIALVGVIALGEAADAVPPVRFPWNGGMDWTSLALVVADPFYAGALLTSLVVAAGTAGVCVALGFPMAWAIARARPAARPWLLGAVMLPFWTGFLPRMGAWIGLLRDEGWINGMLVALGFDPQPLLYSDAAMLIGMVHAYLPFAVLPLFGVLLRLDPALEDAAADLGAGPVARFWTVVLPQAAPGIAAAFLLVFIPAAGEYVIPELLGPPGASLVGRVVVQEFFQNRDWPVAAALSLGLLVVLLPPLWLFQRLEAGR